MVDHSRLNVGWVLVVACVLMIVASAARFLVAEAPWQDWAQLAGGLVIAAAGALGAAGRLRLGPIGGGNRREQVNRRTLGGIFVVLGLAFALGAVARLL